MGLENFIHVLHSNSELCACGFLENVGSVKEMILGTFLFGSTLVLGALKY